MLRSNSEQMIKGRLLSSVTNAKALDCANVLCVTLTFDL